MSNLKRMAAIEALKHINQMHSYLCSAKEGAALQIDKLSNGDELNPSVQESFEVTFTQLEECRGWLMALSAED